MTKEQWPSAGIRQMGEGIVQTIRSELGLAIPSGIIGWGLGFVTNEPAKQARVGIIVGTILGWEKSALDYNKTATEKRLPEVQWYDWVAANVIQALLLSRGTASKTLLQAALAAQVLNPITLSGARHLVFDPKH